MPRKKNKRKAIQKAARAAQPKTSRVAAIGHVGVGGQGLAMAVLASGIMRHCDIQAMAFEDFTKWCDHPRNEGLEVLHQVDRYSEDCASGAWLVGVGMSDKEGGS